MSDSEPDTSDADEECECAQCGKTNPTRHVYVSDYHKHDDDEMSNLRDDYLCFCGYNCLMKWAKTNAKKYPCLA